MDELVWALIQHAGSLWGMTVYAHGSLDGRVGSPAAGWTSQMNLINAVKAGGYKVAEVNMMQCYSKATVFDALRKEKINYEEKWREVAKVFNGYFGVNAFGIDF